MLLSKIFEWRSRKAGEREFAFVASGLGEGGSSEIIDLRYSGSRDKRLDRAKQIVAGSMTTKIATGSHIGHSITRGIENHIGSHHQFTHNKWTSKRNYALVSVFTEDEEGVSQSKRQVVFTFNHVTATAKRRHEQREKSSKKRSAVCCGGWINPCGGKGKAFGPGSAGHAKAPRAGDEFASIAHSVSFTE